MNFGPKISDFEIVKNVKPTYLIGKNKEEMKEILSKADDIKETTWQGLVDLVGTEWVAGLNTPFDPRAAALGLKLEDTLTLYIGRKEQIPKMLKNEEFIGTVVKC